MSFQSQRDVPAVVAVKAGTDVFNSSDTWRATMDEYDVSFASTLFLMDSLDRKGIILCPKLDL